MGFGAVPKMKLRQDSVRTLPYVSRDGRQQCVYWDETVECFGLRIYPSGKRTYVCTYRIQRRKRLAALGRADVLTLDQARKKAIAYLGKVASNEDPQEESDALRKLKTVSEVYDVFKENHLQKKRRKWKDDDSRMRRYVLPKLKGRLVSTVTSADIEALHSEVGTLYQHTANDILDVVRKMYNWGKTAGYVPRDYANPATGIVRFPERKRRRFITTVEMPRFVRALEEENSEYARHGLWMLLLTGLRTTELLKAKWTDIDWDNGTLFIGLTKNGDPLLTPLSDAAITRLKLIPQISNNPHIICGQKRGGHLTDLGGALKRVLRRAAIENVRVHDLRRTVGSWLAQDGRSLHLIGDVLNHRDPKTTAGYAYFQTQQRRDALTSHGDRVLALGAPHLRAACAPEAVSAKSLLPGETGSPAVAGDAAPSHRHYFRRDALYDLVWTAPVSEVAVRLGVSDVALAKLCRRACIPIPARGYWARVESGQTLERPPLPAAPADLPELLRIRGARPNRQDVPSSAKQAAA